MRVTPTLCVISAPSSGVCDQSRQSVAPPFVVTRITARLGGSQLVVACSPGFLRLDVACPEARKSDGRRPGAGALTLPMAQGKPRAGMLADIDQVNGFLLLRRFLDRAAQARLVEACHE